MKENNKELPVGEPFPPDEIERRLRELKEIWVKKGSGANPDYDRLMKELTDHSDFENPNEVQETFTGLATEDES